MNPESFERTKKDFLEKNEKFAKAVEQITLDNHKSLEQKLMLATLHVQAIESYNLFMKLIGVIKN
jgi:hypothetical protein